MNDIQTILDNLIDEINTVNGLYDWQYHKNYGYLTACPGNSGTGIRISFRINIHGLKKSGTWGAWKKNLKDAGLVIRGHRGEGSPETDHVEISSINSWNFNIKGELLRTITIIERLIHQ